MPVITFISASKAIRTLDVRCGLTLMEAAVHNAVEGVDADCGGACACATCQLVIDDAWIDRVGQAQGQEAELLEFSGAGRNVRLGCQIVVSERLGGLVVATP